MSIYSTPASWVGSHLYTKNSIITNTNYYYYATVSHTSGSAPGDGTFATDYNLGRWDGIGIATNGSVLPRFFWPLSFGVPVNFEPKVNVTQFGDGYEQRAEDGLDSVVLAVDAIINGMDLDMANAIGFFFYTLKSARPFLWTPFPPFENEKRFICRNWTITPDFYNNYSLKARFEEVAF